MLGVVVRMDREKEVMQEAPVSLYQQLIGCGRWREGGMGDDKAVRLNG